MTTVVETRPTAPRPDPARRSRRADLLVVAVLMLVAGVTTAVNLSGYPIRFGDEGTYVSQAWAIPNLGELAHYTYWYDHPPLGWLQMSVYAELTFAWERWSDNTTMVGREFAVLLRMVSTALLYVLARRVGMRRFWAATAALLFVLSPLAVHYGRLALLDNIAMPWVLAAFVLAFSPRHRWSASIGSALCFAVAVLSKETLLLLAPALALAIWTNYRRSANRGFVLVSFGLVGFLTVLLYPLYAATKSELIPGAGHVSLLEAVEWQLRGRVGSGSVFDPDSDAHNLVRNWLELDPWLPVIGTMAAVPLLFDRRLRPLMLALLVQVVMLLRQGYLPAMYVTMLLPFLALAVGGLGDRLWPRLRALGADRSRRATVLAAAGAAVAIGAAGVATPFVAPAWAGGLQRQWSVDDDAPQRAAVAWLRDNVPHDAVLVSEAELWLDLHNAGFTGPGNVWVYKVDSDPSVAAQLGGWQRIEYLALSRATLDSQSLQTMPWVFEALAHAHEIARFGSGANTLTVLRVTPG
ncbi:MAG TPA: glycosyltransferase family 39 protein [Aldersonia sp.]